MATVRKRGEYYYYRFKVRNGDSYKWIERGNNYKTKKEAQEAGNRAEAEWHTRLSIWEPRQVLYGQMLKEWQIHWCNIQYKGSTLDSVRKDINIVASYLGDQYIHLITPVMMQEVLTDLARRHYSRHRLGKIKGVMFKSFRWAVEQGWIRNSPAAVIRVPAPRACSRLGCAPEKELRALTKEEVEAIFNRFGPGSSAYIPLLMGYRCGLRLGEVFGLEISDFDADTKTINVRQQLGYHGKDLYVSAPKYESRRRIKLDDDTASILAEHVTRITTVEQLFGNSELFKRYYIQQDGKVTETPAVREFRPLNRRIENGALISPRITQHLSRVVHGCTLDFGYPAITDFSFHQLRHTHCSELISFGFSVEFVAKRLGHKDSTTTMRYYSHLMPEVQDRSEEQLKNFYR